VGKGKRPKAQAKPQIVRAHSNRIHQLLEYGVCAARPQGGPPVEYLTGWGMCRWAIAPPRCGLLAVEYSREATFIAAAGFAVATLPMENEVVAGVVSRVLPCSMRSGSCPRARSFVAHVFMRAKSRSPPSVRPRIIVAPFPATRHRKAWPSIFKVSGIVGCGIDERTRPWRASC
jgi:hypothetical protein